MLWVTLSKVRHRHVSRQYPASRKVRAESGGSSTLPHPEHIPDLILCLLWRPGGVEQVAFRPVDNIADVPFPEGGLAGVPYEKVRVEIPVLRKERERLALFQPAEYPGIGWVPVQDDERTEGGKREQPALSHHPPDVGHCPPVCVKLVCSNKAVELLPYRGKVLPDVEVPLRSVRKDLRAEGPGKEPVVRDDPGVGITEESIGLRGLSRARYPDHTKTFSGNVHAGAVDRRDPVLVLKDITTQSQRNRLDPSVVGEV